MPSVNDKILDEIIGHSVDLQRLEASVKFRIRKELKKLEKGLVDELNNSNIWDAKRQQTRQKRLKALLKQTKETIESTYKAISKEHLNTLTGVASLAERQAISSINNSINFELTSVSMSKQMLKAIASDTLFEGAPSKEWWARRSVAFQARFADTVRQGMMRGDDTKTITRNLVGTAKNKFKDGALAPNYRSAEALVRTSIQSVANTARIETYQDNKDLIKGIQWSSTFDSRTSETCATLDGEQWNMDFEPLNGGPVYPGSTAHWNCRSTTVAIIKSWEELGAKGKFKEIPKSTQASMDGQVSGKLNYEGWLKSKSKAMQEDVLGVTKRKLWKEGKLGFSDLVSGSGKPLTLEQLNIKLDKPKKTVKAVVPRVAEPVKAPARPIFNQHYKTKTPEAKEKTWRKWDNDQENTVIHSKEEAFHKWGTWHYPEFKQEFASGKLTSPTAKSMAKTFKKYDGDHDGSTLYRGMIVEKSESEDFVNYIKGLKKGDVLSDSSPLSFTKDSSVAKAYYKSDDVIEGQDLSVLIKAKKVKKQGFDISDISNHMEEAEVVIVPDTKFKIIKIIQDEKHLSNGYRNGEWVDDIKTIVIEVEVI